MKDNLKLDLTPIAENDDVHNMLNYTPARESRSPNEYSKKTDSGRASFNSTYTNEWIPCILSDST